MIEKTARSVFESFLSSADTLWIMSQGDVIFRSQRKGIAPLICYLEQASLADEVTVFDKVTGNAAALLLKKANGRELFSSLGSRLAAETLRGFGIEAHFTHIVPYIINRSGNGMCPFEKLSLGKTPGEFYENLEQHPLFADIFHESVPCEPI
jgi:hypothetical protein